MLSAALSRLEVEKPSVLTGSDCMGRMLEGDSGCFWRQGYAQGCSSSKPAHSAPNTFTPLTLMGLSVLGAIRAAVNRIFMLPALESAFHP